MINASVIYFNPSSNTAVFVKSSVWIVLFTLSNSAMCFTPSGFNGFLFSHNCCTYLSFFKTSHRGEIPLWVILLPAIYKVVIFVYVCLFINCDKSLGNWSPAMLFPSRMCLINWLDLQSDSSMPMNWSTPSGPITVLHMSKRPSLNKIPLLNILNGSLCSSLLSDFWIKSYNGFNSS